MKKLLFLMLIAAPHAQALQQFKSLGKNPQAMNKGVYAYTPEERLAIARDRRAVALCSLGLSTAALVIGVPAWCWHKGWLRPQDDVTKFKMLRLLGLGAAAVAASGTWWFRTDGVFNEIDAAQKKFEASKAKLKEVVDAMKTRTSFVFSDDIPDVSRNFERDGKSLYGSEMPAEEAKLLTDYRQALDAHVERKAAAQAEQTRLAAEAARQKQEEEQRIAKEARAKALEEQQKKEAAAKDEQDMKNARARFKQALEAPNDEQQAQRKKWSALCDGAGLPWRGGPRDTGHWWLEVIQAHKIMMAAPQALKPLYARVLYENYGSGSTDNYKNKQGKLPKKMEEDLRAVRNRGVTEFNEFIENILVQGVERNLFSKSAWDKLKDGVVQEVAQAAPQQQQPEQKAQAQAPDLKTQTARIIEAAGNINSPYDARHEWYNKLVEPLIKQFEGAQGQEKEALQAALHAIYEAIKSNLKFSNATSGPQFDVKQLLADHGFQYQDLKESKAAFAEAARHKKERDLRNWFQELRAKTAHDPEFVYKGQGFSSDRAHRAVVELQQMILDYKMLGALDHPDKKLIGRLLYEEYFKPQYGNKGPIKNLSELLVDFVPGGGYRGMANPGAIAVTEAQDGFARKLVAEAERLALDEQMTWEHFA